MSVVGFDIGYQSCYIAVARQGGIDTVANEYSDRCTPSYVSFGQKQRLIGNSAKIKMASNLKGTIWGFTKLLGRKFNDPIVQHERSCLPCRIVENSNGDAVYRVNYLNEDVDFTSEQVTAMLLTKLREVAETNLRNKVVDCVISVPCYFTDIERRAMINASKIAGLNCLRVMNATTATALAYGIYKTDLPEESAKARNVVFVDFGHSCLQVSAVSFNKGKLKVLATSFDNNLGGRDFDLRIANHFVTEFKNKYKVDASTSIKAFSKLLESCEKLKKLMSSNATEIPMNIECFMDDKDVSGRMKRSVFEDISSDLFEKIEICLKQIIINANIKSLDDIHSIEIIGGSSRIPKFKQMVTDIFKKEPSTTMNADEAVSRGCALQCAILSPTFKVRDFSIADCQPYAINLKWVPMEDVEQSDMEIFPKFHPYPFSRMLTFYRKQPFQVDAYYNDNVPHPTLVIGSFNIDNVVPTKDGETSKVKVKVRINGNGICSVLSASLVEKYEVAVVEDKTTDKKATTDDKKDEAMEVEQNKNNATQNGPAAPSNEADVKNTDENLPPKPQQTQEDKEPMQVDGNNIEGTDENGDKKSKTKTKIKNIDLPVISHLPGMDFNKLNNLIEKELQMISNDKLEQERAAAKNAVEEYVYDIRDKISTVYESFVQLNEKEKISMLLDQTYNWLYEEGEDEKKQVYLDKLAELKKYGSPIAERYTEHSCRPSLFEQFASSIQQIRKAIQLWQEKNEKYDHLTEEDMQKVCKAVEEKQSWLDKQMGACNGCELFKNPPITCSQIKSEKQVLETIVSPILNKPKPKVEPPKEDKKEDKKENVNAEENKDKKDSVDNTNVEQKTNTMEVD